VLGNRKLVSKLPRYMWMDATSVAREGYRAVMDGKPVHVPGGVNRTIAAVTKLIPESIALAIMKRQTKRIRVAN